MSAPVSWFREHEPAPPAGGLATADLMRAKAAAMQRPGNSAEECALGKALLAGVDAAQRGRTAAWLTPTAGPWVPAARLSSYAAASSTPKRVTRKTRRCLSINFPRPVWLRWFIGAALVTTPL